MPLPPFPKGKGQVRDFWGFRLVLLLLYVLVVQEEEEKKRASSGHPLHSYILTSTICPYGEWAGLEPLP
jgi:hypothetical protein